MKTIKDTPGREKETSPTHKIVFNQIQNRINDEDKEVVEYCQKEFPETCDEFLNISADQYVLFCKKQRIMVQVIYPQEQKLEQMQMLNYHKQDYGSD